jgi:hypothetical protein
MFAKGVALVAGKRFAAIVLAVCFVLPLSECSDKRPSTTPQVEVQYAYSAPSTTRFFVWAAFLWPLIGCMFAFLPFIGRPLLALRLSELALIAGSGWVLIQISVIADRLLYGTYLAIGALVIYGTATLTQIVNEAMQT